MRKILAAILFCVLTAAAQSPAVRVSAVLDNWHRAAAVADETAYFAHFSPDGVFMGTDATERWSVKEFRAWARPHFDAKKTWNFKPRDRHTAFSADGKTAWFDEMLDTEGLGICRGSGVLVNTAGQWKIAQYNLSIPIPNEVVKGIVKEIAVGGK